MVEWRCRIGDHADIEAGDIHAIQKGIRNLVMVGIQDQEIIICMDNQNV